MEKINIKYYSDSMHGWLAIKKNVLEKYGILRDISTYSYIKGKTVYLEEDSDANILINTLKDNQVEYSFRDVYHGDKSYIRNYKGIKDE